MKITRTSTLSSIERTMDLPVSEEQMQRWQQGEYIQVAMSNLTADQREFILTGVTPEEWDEYFPPEESFDDENGHGQS